MKRLRTIVKTTIWTIVIIYFTVIMMVRIPFVQRWLGEQVGNALQDELGTKVTVERIDIGLLNRVIIDGLMIYDQQSKPMIRASRMAAKLDYYQLIKNQRIYISSVQAFGFKGDFYKKDELSKPNYQFVIDSLASEDTNKKTSINLSISSLIIRHGAVKYDRHDMPFTSSRFNLNHINVSDISAHLIIPYYTNDSLALIVKKLSLNESSGFKLKNFTFEASADKQKAEVNDLSVKLPDTEVYIPSLKASYRYNDGKIDKKSLKFSGDVDKSKFTLSDISCFVPYLKTFSTPLFLSTQFHGDSRSLNVSRLNLSSSDNGISLTASGTVVNFKKPRWNIAISQLGFNVMKADNVLKGIEGLNFNLPEAVTRLGNISYRGTAQGAGSDIAVGGHIATDIGDANIKIGKHGERISAEVNTGGLDMQKLFADNHFGTLTASLSVNGIKKGEHIGNLNINGVFGSFDYNGYSYKNITVKGVYDKQIFSGMLALDDVNGQININGKFNTNTAKQEADITATVRNLDLAALRLSDKWKGSTFSFNLEAFSSGKKENILNGNVSLSDFIMQSDESTYRLDRLNVTAGPEHIAMQSDFGHAELEGRYNLNSILKSFTNILHSKLPSLYENYSKADNKFRIEAEITKTDWLEHVLNIPLTLESPLKMNAEINDVEHLFNFSCGTDKFIYDGNAYEKALIKAASPNDTLFATARIKKVMTNGHRLSLSLDANAASDKLSTVINWDNHLKHPIKGKLVSETDFSRNASGKSDVHMNVKPSEIQINDTVWNVQPATISYVDGNLLIDRFSIEHNKQHIKIDGIATKNLSDSITVDLQDVNVNYVLNLINFHSVDFKGYATGKAYIKSVFYEPELYADLNVRQFRFEDGRMGELFANVKWNKAEKQIDIDAHADDEGNTQTIIKGFVSPDKNYIDLGIRAVNTNAEFLESFCGSFMDDVKIRANGEVRVHGPLNSINLTGKLTTDGSVRIKPLNTTYTLSNDTINFLPDNIVFNADTIRDRNGNIGIVNGALHHEHLTHLTYDVRIDADHLLCYDTKGYGNETFYGTAYGTGVCSIKGGNGRIDIDLNITPNKNSFIEYNAASPDAIYDQQFIRWNDKTAEVSDSLQTDTIMHLANKANAAVPIIDIPSDMHINFIVNMTPDATLRVLMDKNTGDYIALNGTGSIRATYFNKGSFDMFGTYLIDHGIYKLTIQNIIKKVFQFQQGGNIIFGGDPYNAALNMKAVYTVNSVPLSDLQIGNSFSSNNVRVDCLMNISGTPHSPRVDFDLDLPTVNSDAEQMVRTVINGEEEMNQQVVYLLSVGRFYMPRNNNSAEQDQQQSQTSLAMQSLLSGTISQQINSLLGNLVKNNNWTFGANISTGDEGFNNAEYEGLLSGRLLNNRLVINGQFGYRDNANATTSFIGDFDVNYLLLPSGNIALKVYNQTNDRYFTKSSLNTQGIGIMMKKDFNTLWDLFGLKRKKKTVSDSLKSKSPDKER